MSEPLFTTVVLDKPRRIRFTHRAKYRLGAMKGLLPLPGHSGCDTQFQVKASLCQYLWAMLDEKHSFESPEDLAEFVPDDIAKLTELVSTLGDCIALAAPNKESKNADSSTPSPSPASS